MVDSRAKGARGEYLVRDMLRDATGLQFERVPASGALEYLKGDIYVPHASNKFCIEVKNYERVYHSVFTFIILCPKLGDLLRLFKCLTESFLDFHIAFLYPYDPIHLG